MLCEFVPMTYQRLKAVYSNGKIAVRRARTSSSINFRNLSTTRQASKENKPLSDVHVEDILNTDKDYNDVISTYLRPTQAYNCFILQPFIKWGPNKKHLITPEEQLEEAVALIQTLPSWSVVDTIKVPLENLEKKALFGTGTLDKLVGIVRSNPEISAVFVNSSHLKRVTTTILGENFHLPILDRYQVVINILKMHANSKHAKLQVALAELYYIQRKSQQSNLFFAHNPETLKLMFQAREQKIKNAIQQLRNQRMLLRNKRRKMELPVIAVVGYTNCGKTCLIKALTGEENLEPKDKLFATLDVTVHEGMLPSGMEVLFVDTVGFLSDLPSNLLECFIATLEDAVLADLVLHVEDLASSGVECKRDTVLTTLQELGSELGAKNIMHKVLSVGNKCDLIENVGNLDILKISAKDGTGLDELRFILEKKIFEVTGRQTVSIKVPNGGDEMRWLHKHSTVIEELPEEKEPHFMNLKVIITRTNLSIFKHYHPHYKYQHH